MDKNWRGKLRLSQYKVEWVFDITIRDGTVAHIKEYIDTQAPARASATAASPRARVV